MEGTSGEHKSRRAEEQESRGAVKQRSRRAEEQESRTKQGHVRRGAGEQIGAGELESRIQGQSEIG